MNPPIAAPPVNPTPPMIIISGPRSRRGLYSPTSAVAFGMMQPSPMPATKRSASSSPTDAARAAAIVMTPKNSVAPMRIGRRPILSASMLKTSDPTSTPKLLAPNTGPSAALEIFHSAHDFGRDVAERLHVEAVHDQTQQAERERRDLKRAKRAVVDAVGDVDRWQHEA